MNYPPLRTFNYGWDILLPAGHSNLGFALCRIGQVDKGLAEIERALTLDQTFLKEIRCRSPSHPGGR